MRLPFTRRQVGAATDPAAHLSVQAPPDALHIEQTGGGFYPGDHAVPRAIRAFRAPNASVQPLPATVGAPLDSTPAQLADVHDNRGLPDQRRLHRGQAEGFVSGEIGQEAAPVTYSNELYQENVTPEKPPARPRQGWTGEDNTRPSLMRRPMVIRTFDPSAMATQPYATTDKVVMRPPTAATSKNLPDLSSPYAYAGGATGTERHGIRTQTRQTVRVVPPTYGETQVQPDTAASPLRSRFR